MAVPLIHRCGHCGYESEISSSLSTFTENPFCRQCGLSASESDSKMQDELSNLFNQRLALSQPAIAETQVTPISPITYITQHYHHSGHMASATTPGGEDASKQLGFQGIDTTALSPSQIRLFSNAQPEQQARLIELWQIAPPTHAERNVGNWPQASMEEEEEAARTRYLKMTSPITLDQSMDDMQVHHHHQQQQNESNHDLAQQHQQAEPYILHGYAAAAAANESNYRLSSDPVYQQQGNSDNNRSREWWSHSNDPQPLEHQYGALMQMREFYDGGREPVASVGGREEDMW